jgi:uncharacterized protein YyaL (SSP411 family)
MPNKLINESSPYLLQHAHNPVQWYAWGEEALTLAKQQDKPILVSIGYAACHWCHVMEHESFEDAATAEIMNTFFINIKVDREERPDLDNIYMNACQILTGAGGWPLNVFLTPEQKPFSAGTYYPPKPAYGKPSWKEEIAFMHNAFVNQRDKVEEQANMLVEHIAKMDNAFVDKISSPESVAAYAASHVQEALAHMRDQFDTIDGGFGNAPKFPAAMTLRFLLRYAWLNKDERIMGHVDLSLHKMHQGGIYDHIGGGFARYATDKKWMIPHFEKMLYDNALLCSLYAEAYRATGNQNWLRVAEEILEYVDRECTDDSGAWYASYDADSEGEEGKYYTFTYDDLVLALGTDAIWAASLFQATLTGNWEETNILHRKAENAEDAAKLNMALADFEAKLTSVRKTLLAFREQRIKPGCDNKIILSWNAMMCSAFVDVYKASGNEKYRDTAIKNITFLTTAFVRPKHTFALWHVVTNGHAKYDAFLEDYATLIQALFDVYEITGNMQWFEKANGYMNYVQDQFAAPEGMFYFTEKDQADIPIRSIEYYDNATPSGNSVMAANIWRRYLLTGNIADAEQAVHMLTAMRAAMIKYGTSFGNWWQTALKLIHPTAEVAVTGPDHQKMRDALFAIYYPHVVIQNGNEATSSFPLLQHRSSETDTRIFVCQNFTCRQPVTTLQDFQSELTSLV